MAVKKLSQISPASPAAITDTIIGVQGGTTDVQFTISNIIPYIPATGNVTFYVSTTGSDSNPGTLAQPFATIQFALNQVALLNYELVFFPTIQVQDGTYSISSAGINIPFIYGIVNFPFPLLQGNRATPANCVLNFSGPGFISLFATTINIQGFTLNNANDNFIIENGLTKVDDLVINLIANSTAFAAEQLGSIQFGADSFDLLITLAAVANPVFVIFANQNGFVNDSGVNWTISGVITCTNEIVSCGGNAAVNWLTGGGTLTNPGNLHGKQFFLNSKSSYFFGSGVPDFARDSIPGTSVGSFGGGSPTIGNDQNYAVATPTSGSTVTMYAVNHQQILNPSGALATLTVVLPTYAADNDVTRISTTQTITSLTISAAATFGVTPTILGAPTTLAAGGAIQFRYDASLTTWFIS